MLLESDPGATWQYGSVATILKYGGNHLPSLFVQPRRLLIAGQQFYVCVLAGVHFFMQASSVAPPEMMMPLFPTQTGEWILLSGDVMDFGYLRPQFEELKNRLAARKGNRKRS